MPLYDFQCSNGHVNEELVKPDVRTIPCPDCEETAERLLSMPHIDWQAFVWGNNASEPAIDKWDKMRKKKMAIEQRKLADHGTYD